MITTCFVGREVREETGIDGDPPGPFVHCQNFPTPDKVLELIAYTYELERKIDPGVPVDTIIVNNDVGWEKGNQYLDSICNTATSSGHLRVIHRPNRGRSFGGYNKAYEVCQGQYDYWTFTEDDILIAGDQYFRICIETFERKPNIGFVAIQGLSRTPRLHAHGGVGTTRFDILENVYRKFGKLPHSEHEKLQTPEDIIQYGEVPFTNSIARMGYELLTVASPRPLYAYAYDHMRGREPEYPAPEMIRSNPGFLKNAAAEIREDIRHLAFRLGRLVKLTTRRGL